MIRKVTMMAAGLAGLWMAPAYAGLSCTALTATTGQCTESLDTGLVKDADSTLNIDLFNVGVVGRPVTLTGASIAFKFGAYQAGSIVNNAISATNGSFNGTANFYLPQTTDDIANNSPLPLDAALATIAPTALNVNMTSGGISLGSLGTQNFTETMGTVSGSVTSANAALADFMGTGYDTVDVSPVNVTGSFVTNGRGGGSGNTTNLYDTYTDTTAVVTYTYSTAVPEPASMIMLASGALALGMARRRARRA